VKIANADNKKRAAIFLGCSFFWWQVVCGTEAFSADWNNATQQRERPKRDRLFASILLYYIASFKLLIAFFHLIG
jgi:hypothetical protein